MKKYCSECGKELQADDKFCLECGTKVIDDEINEQGLEKGVPSSLEKKTIPPPVMSIKSNDQETKSNNNIKNPINSSESISGNLEKKISSNKIFLYVLGGLVLVAFVLFMVLKESNQQEEAIKKLDEVELKIQEAIKNKDYDYALVLVEQLTYSVNLNYEENKKIAQQYDDKRNSLRSTITKLKEQFQSAISDNGTLRNSTDDGTLKVLTPITDSDIKAFIESFNSDVNVKNIDGILGYYANEVDYFGKGKVDKKFIMNDKIDYFRIWDDVNYQLVDNSLSVNDLPDNSKFAVFNIEYSVYSSTRNKKSTGMAQSFLKIRRGENGLEIYDEKQKIISRNDAEGNSNTKSEQIRTIDQTKNINESTNARSDELVKEMNERPQYLKTADQMPEPIGGILGIQKNIIYPEIAKRAGVEGTVYLLTFVDESGNVTDAKIIKGIGAGCDEAAIDAIKKTIFNPGTTNGKTVKVQVTIPIVFKLQ